MYSYIVQLDATSWSNISNSSRVLYDKYISSTVYVKLPIEVTGLIDVLSVTDMDSGKPIQFSRENKHPWISISKDDLDISIGMHTCKVVCQFKDLDAIDLYFRFIIQTEDFDKPYIYMSEKER